MWYLIVSIPDLCNLTYFDMTDMQIINTKKQNAVKQSQISNNKNVDIDVDIDVKNM